jgi:exodeoxyribonuclease VII large subunit
MPSVELIVVHAVMQGDASPDSVRKAIERVDAAAEKLGIDAVIVTRGGGGLEELWSFNDRKVVEAAYHCDTPIVVAIGHESDTSIIELVADHRASTPTQATMVLIPDREELLQMISHGEIRLSSVVSRVLERCDASIVHLELKLQTSVVAFLQRLTVRLSKQAELLISRRPHALLQGRQKILLIMQSALCTSIQTALRAKMRLVDTLGTQLESIGPLEVLRRGYSLTQDSAGNVVLSSADVKEGEKIHTILADGAIDSTVECTR